MKALTFISIVLVITASAGVALGQVPASLTFEPPMQTVGLGGLADVGIRIDEMNN